MDFSFFFCISFSFVPKCRLFPSDLRGGTLCHETFRPFSFYYRSSCCPFLRGMDTELARPLPPNLHNRRADRPKCPRPANQRILPAASRCSHHLKLLSPVFHGTPHLPQRTGAYQSPQHQEHRRRCPAPHQDRADREQHRRESSGFAVDYDTIDLRTAI